MTFWQRFKNDAKAKDAYLLKVKILKLIRDFFNERGFIEFEAPILNTGLIPESYLDIFETEERRVGLEGTVKRQKYMMTSPESFQKKMMVAGFESNFAITKSFRNGEPLSKKHLSEFSLLEWYEKGSNYLDVMKTTEDLFNYILKALHGASAKTITYKGKEIDLSSPWERVSINNSFKKLANVDLEETWNSNTREFSVKQLTKQASHLNLNVFPETTWEQLYNQIFLTYIDTYFEEHFQKPVILYDFPAELSPLAKDKPGEKVKDHIWAERFEAVIGGLEICDTYSENTDGEKQERLFKEQIKKIKAAGKTQYTWDWDFVNALNEGLSTCSGNALGIDRMVMIFGGLEDISVFDLSH
jgi:elongation factor P--beta-lysine ligase